MKAVIFDLDDTLYPEQQYALSGFKAVADHISRRTDIPNAFGELADLFSLDKRNVFDRFILKHGLSIKSEDLHTVYVNHTPRISLYDDVLPCFKKLTGCKLGLITDGRPIQQRNKIGALNIAEYFDSIIVTDELGAEFRKPHPKAFEITKGRLGIEYREMTCVGDNPAKDFYIGALHSVRTVRILREGYYDGEYYKGVKPDLVIESLYGLEKLLK